MVCFEMEDRGVPQDPQIGLQSRGVEAQDRPASDQSGLGLLHPELADFLDDDAQAFSSGRAAGSRTDSDGNRRARSPRERKASNSAENALALSNQDRKARRLSRPRQRSSAGQHSYVARSIPPDFNRAGSHG